MSKKKIHGQVFTPVAVVREMLDSIDYTADNVNILSRTIMEPSFGKGVFLIEIAKRIIAVGKKSGISSEEISKRLADNIYGIELDAELHEATIDELRSFCREAGIQGADFPNLHQDNSLDWRGKLNGRFDYVVGNPPYVRIHNIDPSDRAKVKNFTFTTGTTDLYVVFFELGLDMLSAGGRMAYITPNSFMKNSSQKSFRAHLVHNGMLLGLTDYRSSKVFDDAATYATITYLGKPETRPEQITYRLEENGSTFTASIPYTSLMNNIGDAWNFADPTGVLAEQMQKPRLFCELAHVQNGVATLRDKLFIDLNPVARQNGTMVFNGAVIEQDILRPVVKGSKHNGGPINGRILFPYQWDGSRYVPMNETRLQEAYPLAYAYLISHRSELESRDIDSNAQTWYQFGRSQSISLTDTPKFLVSAVIHPDRVAEVYELPTGTIVYSGFFMIANEGTSLADLKSVLETHDFSAYAKVVGKDMSGGFVAISPKHVRDYRFNHK